MCGSLVYLTWDFQFQDLVLVNWPKLTNDIRHYRSSRPTSVFTNETESNNFTMSYKYLVTSEYGVYHGQPKDLFKGWTITSNFLRLPATES